MSSEIYPKDFFSRKIKLDPNLCFILMPIKSEYDDIKKAINDIVRDCGFEPVRADDIQQPGIIHTDIWDRIQRAVAIIADVTEHNPNVFFELGVACATKDKSRVIIIRQAGSRDDNPFDIRPFRCIFYTNDIGGARKLAEDLKSFLKTIRREDDAILDVLDRMRKWKENEHDYDFLLPSSELRELRRLPGVEQLDKEILSYALASSLLNMCNCKFWTGLNKDNIETIESLSYMLCGPYRHPILRTAYCLQFVEEKIRISVIKNVLSRNPDPFLSQLIEGIRMCKVQAVIEKEAGKAMDLNVAREVLSEIQRWDFI